MIHRSEHKKDFVVIDLAIARNTALSSDAVRLLVFMLSCADEWDFSIAGLSHQLGWDYKKTMRAVKDLKEAGYIVQNRQKDEKGFFKSCEWHIYESTILPKTHSVDNPQCGQSTVWMNHSVVDPQCGKKVAISNINTKVISTKSNIKSKSSIRAKFVPPTLEEVQAYCQSRNSDVDPKKFFEYYDAGGWKDAKGNPVKNWKQKLITWEGRQGKAQHAQAAESPNNSKIDEALKIALQRAEGGIS